MTTHRTKHSISSVIEYWRGHLDELPRSYARAIGWDEPFCFACHRVVEVDFVWGKSPWECARTKFELAHLKNFWIDGDDSVSDVIPLCPDCHDSMPTFDTRQDALEWLNSPHRLKRETFRSQRRLSSSIATSAAIQKLKAEGKRFGRPVGIPDDVRMRIVREREDGKSYRAIIDGLVNDGVPTARGGKWYPSTIRAVIASVELDESVAKIRNSTIQSDDAVSQLTQAGVAAGTK